MKDPKQAALEAILSGIDDADAKDTWGDHAEPDGDEGKPVGGVAITISVAPKSKDELEHDAHDPENPVEGCPMCAGGKMSEGGEVEPTGKGPDASSGEVPEGFIPNKSVPKWAKRYSK